MAEFSWTSKKYANPNPPKAQPCCLVCFKRIPDERYQKFNKRCEECESSELKNEKWERKPRRGSGFF